MGAKPTFYMNRREWIKSVLSAVVASQIPIDLSPASLPVSLMGIPYHQSDATTGTWLGIVRSTEPWNWKPICEQLCIKIEPRPTDKVS